jgi:hypothetical protein
LSSKEDTAGAGPGEDWSLENLDEVLLTELQRDDGSTGYVVYRNGSVVDAVELENLCDKVGWPRRPHNKVQAALANSFLVATLTLEDEPPASSSSSDASSSSNSGSSNGGSSSGGNGRDSRRGRLIGLARCTSDGAFNATLWDILVDPEFQGRVSLAGCCIAATHTASPCSTCCCCTSLSWLTWPCPPVGTCILLCIAAKQTALCAHRGRRCRAWARH